MIIRDEEEAIVHEIEKMYLGCEDKEDMPSMKYLLTKEVMMRLIE